jgi:hypothetical protein
MLWPTPFPPPPAGADNYDQLVAIGKRLSGEGYDWRRQIATDLQVAAANEAVPLLAVPNIIPTAALDTGRNDIAQRTREDLNCLHMVFSALHEATNHAMEEGEYDRAGTYAIAFFRLDEMFSRGGLLTETRLVQFPPLQECRNKLSSDQVREVIALIEHSLARREPPEVLYRRNFVQHARYQLWQGRLKQIVIGWPSEPLESSNYYLVTARQSEAVIRSIQVLYAIRLFQEEHRWVPQDLNELAPQFLPTVPLDPYSGKPLMFLPDLSSYKLYSVGPNGIDDGGKADDIDLSWSTYQK